ncbi:MAG: hypothetical protein MHM6MM_001983 [Cercozoa sp. M6MM]
MGACLSKGADDAPREQACLQRPSEPRQTANNASADRTSANTEKSQPKVELEPRPRDESTAEELELREDYEMGEKLRQVPLLARLTERERAKIGGALSEVKFDDGAQIIRQDDIGDEFFIIAAGHCVIVHTDAATGESKEIARLSEGDYFGETALLNKDRRGASVYAADGPVVCMSLDRDTFERLFTRSKQSLNVAFGKRKAISAERMTDTELNNAERAHAGATREKDEQTRQLIAQAVRENVLFSNLDSTQLARIVDEMYRKEVPAGSTIIRQGEPGDNFYVVERGEFEIFVCKPNASTEKLVARRGAGTSFGELALMYNSPRAATVRACEGAGHEDGAVVWAMDRVSFRKILMNVSKGKLEEFENFLKTVPILSSLLVNERAKVAEAIEEQSFKREQKVVQQGEPGNAFYIIRHGEAEVWKSEDGPAALVSRLRPGDFFGERALLTDEPRAATIQVASSRLECLVLQREDFTALLGPLNELMTRNLERYEKTAVGALPAEDGPPQMLEVEREDLEVIGTLGKGSFGHVQLVRDRRSGQTFALKAVSKGQVVQLSQQEHIMNEKRTMAQLNHPMLIRLCQTYQDEEFLHFLLEACLGGELFSVLRNRSVFDEDTARFYAGCVVLAFEYMHTKNIIYRDLKPENLLLDRHGYLKVTDFGFAKVVHDRTWTLCGTPDYLAPEVVSGLGHGKGVDWWTLGILIYEMLASYPPFYDEDAMKTYAKIVHGQISYPKHFSRESVDLIGRLLHPKPVKRLGVVKGGARLIKQHPWFRDFDWDALERRTMKAPIVPRIKDEFDLSNFEDYPDEDEPYPPYVDDGSGWCDDF